MKKSLFALLYAALLVFVCSLPVVAETITCAECGMKSDLASKFTSKIIQGEKTLYFCDIGDLFTYLNKKKPENARAEVKDYNTGEWLDVHKAFYVHADKKFRTPMGWGIASFKDKNDAAAYGIVMDFEGAIKAVK